jgi:hypothetical protein
MALANRLNLSLLLDEMNIGVTSVGSYPLFAVMGDCETMCPKCVRDNRTLIEANTLESEGCDRDWALIGIDINYEDEEMLCVHCGNFIPSAYGDETE